MDFFKDIRSSATEAAFEAQRLVRVQSQQLAIARLRKARDDAALTLGIRAAEKARQNPLNDQELMDLALGVHDSEAQIQDAELELERIRAEQPPGRTEHNVPTTDETGSNLLCFKCGAAVPEGASYCTKCGTQVRDVAWQGGTDRGTEAGSGTPQGEASTAAAGGVPDSRSQPPTAQPGPFENQHLQDLDAAPQTPEYTPNTEGNTGDAQAAPGSKPRLCPNCGTAANLDARFCIECGAGLPA